MARYCWGILNHDTGRVVYFNTAKARDAELARLRAEGSGWYVPVYDR